jgi:hypothetical protein
MSFMINFENISEDYNCGNEETLETLIYKNITYTFNEHDINSLRNGSLGTFQPFESFKFAFVFNRTSICYHIATGRQNVFCWRSQASVSQTVYVVLIKGIRYIFVYKGLQCIKVKDCFLTGFFSDIGNTLLKTTPDTLQVLDIQHSIILIGLADLMSQATSIIQNIW